ncbi:precorrin-2 C(20)-methyltransferase [Tessaracoccus flavescens]|uniref:Precorrin-2 C(20)-methyltransferase n=1 Tax=Tessaracoccus flavescens TaxID=399497 RepID=A0A1Q2CU96_9ACTN|nr:precorrin-2 C(20)-methyltransferase [Tessaracoccus flavescens]AQP49678.1 precorrin-2 C(20)-methyltransferase [Tessaracoccus flavescens]
MAHPILVGVGVGPGDPELITVKAVRQLSAADAVLVPATEESGDGPGRAEQIVTVNCPDARIVRIPFSMTCRRGISEQRKASWRAAADAAVGAFLDGAEIVVFATVGDPSVYSTFSYLAAHVVELLPEVEIQVVPGVTAMQALAAESRTPLVEGTETLALVPATAGLEKLSALLDAVDTVVAYKGGRRLPEVAATIRGKGRDAVLGINLGLEGQELHRLSDLDDDRSAPYFSAVLAPAHRGETGGRL